MLVNSLRLVIGLKKTSHQHQFGFRNSLHAGDNFFYHGWDLNIKILMFKDKYFAFKAQ
jgi:hypothetical protein